jgi:hypothetical protein
MNDRTNAEAWCRQVGDLGTLAIPKHTVEIIASARETNLEELA